MADELAVNLPDINAEIDKLSVDDLQKSLLTVRVRQKVQQKKHYNPEKMKEYQRTQRERQRAMKTRALATPATAVDPTTHRPYANLWEQITAQALVQAEAKIAAEAAGAAADESADEDNT